MSAPSARWGGSARLRELNDEDAVLSALLTSCAQRDQAALARFYDLTSRWVYTLIRRRGCSAASADDAVVTVYAKVWRRAADFPAVNRSALAWVTSIAFEGRS